MRRVVRAVRDAELALVAEVREGRGPGRQPVRLAVHLRAVERPEEDVEGRAQVVAAPARVADVRHAPELLVDGRRIGEVGGRRIEGHPSVGAEVVEALLEAARVRLLGAGQRLEPLGDLGEAFLARRPGEARVHLRVLVGLALDGGLQVRVRVADREARRRVAHLLQEVEVAERVARLGLGGVAEEAADLGIALDVGAAREVEIAAVRLRLAGEGVLQVLVGLGSVQRGHVLFPSVFPPSDSPGRDRRIPDRGLARACFPRR